MIEMAKPKKEREVCGFYGKIRHATKAAAKAHRHHLMKNRKANHGRTNVLKCGLCDGWHVGRR